jgi:anti-sigma B factor antagonist
LAVAPQVPPIREGLAERRKNMIGEGRQLVEQAMEGRAAELPEPFRVETRPDRDRAIVIPHGEIDLSTVDAVAAEIDALVARGFDRIVLDLRRTSFMDSTGLRLAIRQTGRNDVRVTLIDGVGPVSRLFDVTGVRDALPFEAGG